MPSAAIVRTARACAAIRSSMVRPHSHTTVAPVSAPMTKSRKGCVEVPPDPVSDVGASVGFHRFSLVKHIELFIAT
jgi:hypothetical protein